VQRYLAITPARVSETLASVVRGKRVVVRTFPEKAKPVPQASKSEGKSPAKSETKDSGKTPTKQEVK
jgi:hypothetical protein